MEVYTKTRVEMLVLTLVFFSNSCFVFAQLLSFCVLNYFSNLSLVTYAFFLVA